MAKILVVDDSEALRAQLRKDLTDAGFEIVEGVDGVNGLAKLKEAKDVQFILCDVNMPNMDGLTMCQNVRLIPEYKDTPIIMLTTEANEEMKKRAKEVGVRAWIAKPYNAPKLVGAIKTLLGK